MVAVVRDTLARTEMRCHFRLSMYGLKERYISHQGLQETMSGLASDETVKFVESVKTIRVVIVRVFPDERLIFDV